ncbi:MAG: flagellar hook-length control protein FliK [Acidithiobacillus sp.]
MTPSANALVPMRIVDAVLNSHVATALAKSITPGTTLEGRVLRSSQVQTLIEVAGKTLAFHLPGQWATGERLQLLYLSGGARPTFLLATSAAVRLPDRVGLSNTVQSLLDWPPAEGGSALRGIQPLLPQPPIESASLAQMLQQSINQSGLFYESHLAAWVQGQLPLQNLRAEPQNGPLSPVPTPVSQGARRVVSALSVSQASEPVLPGRVAGAMTYAQIANLGRPPVSFTSAALPGALTSLVGQQIQVLNQQQINWIGPVWPGQFVQWMISRRDEHTGDHGQAATADREAAQHWDSTLTLHLPHLGSIQAKLRLHRNTLSLAIMADQADALRNRWGDLEAALQALGLRVTQHKIHTGDGE